MDKDDLVGGRGRPSRHIREEVRLPRVRAATDGYEYQGRAKTVHVSGLPGNPHYYRVEAVGLEAGEPAVAEGDAAQDAGGQGGGGSDMRDLADEGGSR